MREVSTLAIKGHRRLALVRYAECHDPVTGVTGVGGDLAQRRHGQIGDLGGVVFDLTGLGKVLGQLAVGGVDDVGARVEGDRTHATRAGVEGEDEVHEGQASELPEGYWAGGRPEKD